MKKFIMYTSLIIFIIVLSYGLAKNRQKKEDSMKNLPQISQDESRKIETTNNQSVTPIDTQKSIIKWSAKKTLVTTNNHTGTISIKDGYLLMENETLKDGEIILDMQTINNTDLSGAMKNKLEEHLKSDDFFATNKFPTAQFKIKQVQEESEQLKITGDLTIKSITHEINFPAKIETQGDTILFSADLEIDRTLWDIRFGSGKFFENLGDNVIDDIIRLSIEISAKK